jgi:hypothetical protein
MTIRPDPWDGGGMPKRSSIAELDVVQNARRVVLESVGETKMNPSMISQVMSAVGRKGGQIGGKRRLETITDARRGELASRAAKARWSKKTKKK